MPAHAHGSVSMDGMTSSTRLITEAFVSLFDRIADPALLVRRLNLVAAHTADERLIVQKPDFEQLNLFTDYESLLLKQEEQERLRQRERRRQEAVISIRKRFGANAILMGMNLQEGATARDRHRQIGGHRA